MTQTANAHRRVVGELDAQTLDRIRQRVRRRRRLRRTSCAVACIVLTVGAIGAILARQSDPAPTSVTLTAASNPGAKDTTVTAASTTPSPIPLELAAAGLDVTILVFSDHPILDAVRDRQAQLSAESASPVEFDCGADAVVSIEISDEEGEAAYLYGAATTTDALVRALRSDEQIQRVAYARLSDRDVALLVVRTVESGQAVVDAEVLDSIQVDGWSAFLIDIPDFQASANLPEVLASPADRENALRITDEAIEGDTAC